MRTVSFLYAICSLLVLAAVPPPAGAESIDVKDCAFLSSLHHTAKGMGYWYDKQNGGLETITGVPYSQLGCGNCHVATCDGCHRSEADGKITYTVATAKDQAKCLTCHAREAAVMKTDKAQGHEDVHVQAGMQCMDCHTAADVHGDGTEYMSMKQPGAVAPRCENCHEHVSGNASHTAHHGTLDCKACHVRQVVSCTNCHFETMVNTGKRVAVPVSGWVFLMNYEGKVTSANMQSFVAPDSKTLLMFAPQFSHSVMKAGRACEDCHGTKVAKQARSGKVPLLWLEKDQVKQATGVIPVGAGAKYGMVYQDYQDGKWSVIKSPVEAPIHYAGYGEPLTKEQLATLAKMQHTK